MVVYLTYIVTQWRKISLSGIRTNPSDSSESEISDYDSLYAYNGRHVVDYAGLERTGIYTHCTAWEKLRVVDEMKYILFVMEHGNVYHLDKDEVAKFNDKMNAYEDYKSHQQFDIFFGGEDG